MKDAPDSSNEKKEQGNSSNEEFEEDAASLSHQVRLLMRRVPHPVAIITASDRHVSQDKPIFRGMTVSSFNTVTLSPEPIVSFNVRRPSETLNALQSSGRFLVHLLAPSVATAKLARDFSRGNENLQFYKQGLKEFEFGVLPASQNATNDGSLLLPILRRRNTMGRELAQEQHEEQEPVIDFPFIFECKYLPQQAIEIHDHTIVLGSVIRVLQRPQQHPQRTRGQIQLATGQNKRSDGGSSLSSSSQLRKDDNGFCLTYADTRFWKMGDQI